MDSEEGIQRVSRELHARTRRLGLLLKPATKPSFLRVVIVNERRDDGFIYMPRALDPPQGNTNEETADGGSADIQTYGIIFLENPKL